MKGNKKEGTKFHLLRMQYEIYNFGNEPKYFVQMLDAKIQQSLYKNTFNVLYFK